MNPIHYRNLVRLALEEDLGRAGDLTTDSIVPAAARSRAVIAARRPGRVAGTDVAAEAFRQLDPEVEIETLIADGEDVQSGQVIARLRGPSRALLSGERTALNFMGHLCGIATVTREIVEAVAGYDSRIVCTRKTTPGLRALEKYAVRMGGGCNHRFGLDDAVLIKDNHLKVAGSVKEALSRVRRRVGHMVKVELEVDTLQQLEQALSLGEAPGLKRPALDAVLLDNMPLDELRRAVQMCRGQVISEASGGITPETAAQVAACGPDLISVGWITHSAPTLDLGLDFE
ncbi:MAG TPA: carboxylating nicotinate-nucleotide diphosphorylase [Acidobacteriota bacterium]|nr:carboxylating nicotinate-nucleotide diphosphorylase [Acidobacteriota bacterium]